MSFGMNNSQSAYGGEKIPSGYKKATLQNYTPQQMQLHGQQYKHVGEGSYLDKLASGDESFFDQIEAPALRQFQGLMGGLGSRFSGMGSKGARNSSGFQNTSSQAASNFAQDLQSKRQDMRQKAISDLMGFSNQILNQKPYDNFLVQKQQKQNPWNSFLGALPGAVTGLLTGGFNPFSGGGGGSSSMTNEMDMGFRSGAPGYW